MSRQVGRVAALRSVDDEKQKISPSYKHGASIIDADMLCGLKSAQRQNQHRICVTPTPHRKPRTSVRGYPYLILCITQQNRCSFAASEQVTALLSQLQQTQFVVTARQLNTLPLHVQLYAPRLHRLGADYQLLRQLVRHQKFV